jgi:hypothetical protein
MKEINLAIDWACKEIIIKAQLRVEVELEKIQVNCKVKKYKIKIYISIIMG